MRQLIIGITIGLTMAGAATLFADQFSDAIDRLNNRQQERSFIDQMNRDQDRHSRAIERLNSPC